jgi:hypothetical protein
LSDKWEGPLAAHPLDGPRGKITRATQQALLLAHHCEHYSASDPVELVTRFDDEAGAHLVFARGRPPPAYLGLILGELVHDLRSALDQLAWQLALQHTELAILEQRKVMTAIQFPISRSGKDFAEHRAIQYFSPEAITLIEIRQPYQNDGSPLLNPLSLLQELSNTDKHQVLRPSLGQIGEAIESFAPLFPSINWSARVDSWVTPDMQGTDYAQLTNYLEER